MSTNDLKRLLIFKRSPTDNIDIMGMTFQFRSRWIEGAYL